MYVCNEGGNFHLQGMEEIFEVVIGITTSFEVTLIIGTFVGTIIGSMRMKRLGIAGSSRRLFGRRLRVVLGHETFHVVFGITDTPREFRGLSAFGM